jgi:hypothetical protein
VDISASCSSIIFWAFKHRAVFKPVYMKDEWTSLCHFTPLSTFGSKPWSPPQQRHLCSIERRVKMPHTVISTDLVYFYSNIKLYCIFADILSKEYRIFYSFFSFWKA